MRTETTKTTKTKKSAAAILNQVATLQAESLPAIPTGAWGSENISAKDFIIPKILVMQGQSTFVTEGTAMVGQLVNSVSREVLGGKWGKDKDQPLNFICFYTFKTWIESEKRGDKFEFVRQIPMDARNEDLPVEYTENGKVMRRDRSINAYCLLPSDITKGEGVIPYIISFRRTSYQAGKKLSSFLGKLADFRQPAAAREFKLTVLQRENEKGKFCTFDIEMLGATQPAHLAVAYQWYQKVKSAALKIDDSDLRTEADQTRDVSEAPTSDDITY
jgi:hypothetical protein